MREIRQSGSEGGGAANPALPTPIKVLSPQCGVRELAPAFSLPWLASAFKFTPLRRTNRKRRQAAALVRLRAHLVREVKVLSKST